MNTRVEYERFLCLKDCLNSYKMQLQAEIADRSARIARLEFELRSIEPSVLRLKSLLDKGVYNVRPALQD